MSQGRKGISPAGRDLFGEAAAAKPVVTPKDAAPIPDLDPARAPRFWKLGAAHIFDHPCSACGAPDAPFGTSVYLRQKRLGTWLCGPCRKKTKG